MKIFVIADPQTVLAFALAGIKGRAVHSADEVAPALRSIDRKEVGLLLITETLAENHRETIEQMLLERTGPLIVEIPDTQGPNPARIKASERVASLVRR
jgi:V/A-type H+/Na+-transporting ATPase subunit F